MTHVAPSASFPRMATGDENPSPKKKPIWIGEMELEDIPKVFELGEELFTADRWPTLYRTWNQYDLIERFASDGEFCLIAEDENDQLIGFAIGTVIIKRASAWDYGHLLWLGVRPGLAGKGIGKRLVAKLTDLFIEGGARMMIVDTDSENEGALRFFRASGFGQETEHIYLYKNLTSHPKYEKKMAEERAARPRRRAPSGVPRVPTATVPPEAPLVAVEKDDA